MREERRNHVEEELIFSLNPLEQQGHMIASHWLSFDMFIVLQIVSFILCVWCDCSTILAHWCLGDDVWFVKYDNNNAKIIVILCIKKIWPGQVHRALRWCVRQRRFGIQVSLLIKKRSVCWIPHTTGRDWDEFVVERMVLLNITSIENIMHWVHAYHIRFGLTYLSHVLWTICNPRRISVGISVAVTYIWYHTFCRTIDNAN